MSLPTNLLQTVQTFQRGGNALLQNSYALIDKANKKFRNFQSIQDNLGSTVTFDLPPRMIATAGLVSNFQGANQRYGTLSVNQAANISYPFNNFELIYNVDKSNNSYLPVFMETAIAELGAQIEGDIAKNAISGVTGIIPGSSNYGVANVNSGPYRFYGNGIDAINSFQTLQQIITNYKNYGAPSSKINFFLPDTVTPPIVGSGLTQFALNRNNELAMNWEIGDFGGASYYISNLMPIQNAGTVGSAYTSSGTITAAQLTVVSTNDPTGANVTQLTLSGWSNNDANAVKSGDVMQFVDGVSGQPNMRYLTFTGHQPSAQPVQFRATANAGSNGSGQVTVNILPGLSWVAGGNQNLNNPIAAGMKVQFYPSHRAGLVTAESAFYLAMPSLPSQEPYPSSSEYDKDSGASIRLTYGTILGQNFKGFIHDVIWDSFLIPEYSMRILFPV